MYLDFSRSLYIGIDGMVQMGPITNLDALLPRTQIVIVMPCAACYEVA